MVNDRIIVTFNKLQQPFEIFTTLFMQASDFGCGLKEGSSQHFLSSEVCFSTHTKNI